MGGAARLPEGGEMSIREKLIESAEKHQNCACMGIDPIFKDCGKIKEHFSRLLGMVADRGLIPSAFKPNIGFFSALDRPLEDDYSGSMTLAWLLRLLRSDFPGIPVILDAKRGDIARSSLNYAIEAFECWGADLVTVSGYMGEDSVMPFAFSGRGAYVLVRTSNPGGRDLQNLVMEGGGELFGQMARNVVRYDKLARRSGGAFGAVVGATNLAELEKVAATVAADEIPILIPGVGSQGGKAPDVMAALRRAGYPARLARINSSSSLTHPWGSEEIPDNAMALCESNIRRLLEECRC